MFKDITDFHTHNLQAEHAIINIPKEWLLQPTLFAPRCNAVYSVGIHPWWTENDAEIEEMLNHLPQLLQHKQVVAVGECGLDALLVSGTNHTNTKETAGGMGFTAVMVSWLAKFNPAIMVLTSFLIVFLQKGAGEIATYCRLNESIADILTGIIIFFIIGSEFFINYKINFRSKHKEVK